MSRPIVCGKILSGKNRRQIPEKTMAKLEGLAHVGIYVSNLKESARFYSETLNFVLFNECALENNDGKVKLGFLRSGNLVLELIELEKPPFRCDGLVDHFAIASEDIETVCEKLRDQGIVFETEEIAYAPNVLGNGCKGIFFRGPDNERIEIVEIL
jgi:lactoylglutathione lyase